MKKNGFPERLKTLRLKKALSQSDLGKIVGVHYSHIGKYERGSSTPKSETLRRLADSLGVSTDFLYEGEIDEVAATRLEDKDLLQMFKEIEKLSEEDKFVVKKLLDAFLTKKKIQDLAKN